MRPRHTRAYHLRRAVSLSRVGDEQGAERERREAEAITPATAPDHFLIGYQQSKRGEFSVANRQFDLATRVQLDHFWVQCLSALCYLRLEQFAASKVRLAAC